MIGWILAWVGLHAMVWCWLWLGLRKATCPAAPNSEPEPGISVVVAMRNEADRVPKLVEALRRQTYQPVEFVLVDDRSEDDTWQVLLRTTSGDPRFKRIRKPDSMPAGKKTTLGLGIEQTAHERLVFTDADGEPKPEWLSVIARYATREPDAVLIGIGPMLPENTALNRFVQYETLLTATLTMAAVGWGSAYMAVGRNFSYPKFLFSAVGGFTSHQYIMSGDDDLFIQAVRAQTRAPIRVVIEPESWVYSAAPANFKRWFHQKTRHFSTGTAYRPVVQGTLMAFHILQWLSWVVLWFNPLGLGIALVARWVMMAWVFRKHPLGKGRLAWLSALPFLDCGYILMNMLIAPLGAYRKPLRW